MTQVLITGGSHGIGLACAHQFAAHDCAVTIVARNATRLHELQLAFDQQYQPGQLSAIAADLATKPGCQAVLDQLSAQQLVPDILINNVGYFGIGDLIDSPEDQLEELLAINLLAAYQLGRGLIPLLLQRGSGHLITIGSVAGDDFPPGVGQYTVSKLALRALHQTWAHELQDSPLFGSLIIPGATLTRSWDPEGFIPDKILQPQQVAALAWQEYSTATPSERWRRCYLRP